MTFDKFLGLYLVAVNVYTIFIKPFSLDGDIGPNRRLDLSYTSALPVYQKFSVPWRIPKVDSSIEIKYF